MPREPKLSAGDGRPSEVRELTMPADFRLLGEARELIQSTGLELGFDEAAIWDMKLAGTEALANAIEHGTAVDGLIHMRLASADGELLLEVSGGGRPEEASGGSDPQRGRGIAIMSALMDEVALKRDGDATVVRLSKRRMPAPADAPR